MSHSLGLTSSRCESILGDFSPPGDKSISHRSIMLGALAEGTTTVEGLLEGEDVLCTIAALRAMGAAISKDARGVWHITGVGAKGLSAPTETLDMGNSGTSARLMMGLIAGQGLSARLTGDASLCKRPMKRVMEPLSQMGVTFESTDGRLPITVRGTKNLSPISYALPVASAQVKSAILLAGLGAQGITTVIEHSPTRDHSENMLRGFGAALSISKNEAGDDVISITGKPVLKAQNILVPSDPSSAAFPLVAAALSAEGQVTLRNVGLNPRRAGLISVLRAMGADIAESNARTQGGEPVADLTVRGSCLHGVEVPPEHAPSMIDEYPILSVAAAFARGTTRMRGLSELRVKESDRLSLMAEGLAKGGVKVDVEGDDLIVHGTGTPPVGGMTVTTAMDHRIAMSFLVMGTRSQNPVSIDNGQFIATSFPGFVAMMNGLGAKITD